MRTPIVHNLRCRFQSGRRSCTRWLPPRLSPRHAVGFFWNHPHIAQVAPFFWRNTWHWATSYSWEYIAREEPFILNILIIRSGTTTIYVSLFQLVDILGNVIRHVLVVYQQKSQLQAMETYWFSCCCVASYFGFSTRLLGLTTCENKQRETRRWQKTQVEGRDVPDCAPNQASGWNKWSKIWAKSEINWSCHFLGCTEHMQQQLTSPFIIVNLLVLC